MLNTCQAQKQFIKQSIIHNIRLDGRKNTTKRRPILNNNVIAHLPGSSYGYFQYQNTQIYTGIKIKLEQNSSNQKPNQIALELTSMRKLREEQNQQMLRIQNILQEKLIKKLSMSKEISEILEISGAKKHKLLMYIDVFLLTQPHISQLQLIIAGIKFALQSTKISQIQVSYNQVTQQQTAEITNNIRSFAKNVWQQIFIIGLIQQENGLYFVVDLKKQEYQSMDACFLVIVADQKVVYIQTVKGTTSIDTINKCVRFVLTQQNKK